MIYVHEAGGLDDVGALRARRSLAVDVDGDEVGFGAERSSEREKVRRVRDAHGGGLWRFSCVLGIAA